MAGLSTRIGAGAWQAGRAIARKLADATLPPVCPVTGVPVDRQGMVSPAFWQSLRFIRAPFCTQCGTPFDVDAPDTNQTGGYVCGACVAAPPRYTCARAALVYDDASKRLILAFKHGDRLHLTASFLPWLLQAGQDMLDGADLIVPVPLHRWRLLARRYNQAALLAQALAKETGKKCVPDVLVRVKATPRQGHLTRAQRAANVAAAFKVPLAKKHILAGKRVVLVDDVLTTGATANACALALMAVGAVSVEVLTIAHTLKAD